MRHLALVAAVLVLVAGGAGAETVLERAKRDAIELVARDDPDMAAAMRKARATLPGFLALARVPPPWVTSLAVKVAISGDNDAREFFWITPFQQRGAKFSGRINNTPRLVKTVKLGQIIAFSQDEIVDWTYHDSDSGKTEGNFTACALLKRDPPDQAEAFKKQFGLSCDP